MGKTQVNVAKHRELGLYETKIEAANVRRGQYLGAAIAGLAIVSALIATLSGGTWQAALALVGVPILGAVQAIVQGR